MTQNTDFQKKISRSGNISVTIPNGSTKSPLFDLNGTQLFGIEIPTGFDAGNITFKKLSLDGKTMINVNDQNQTAYTLTVAAGFCPVDPTIFAGIDQFQIVSSATVTANRVIYLVQAPLFS